MQRHVNDPKPPAPEYKVYRSRRRPLSGIGGGGDLDALRQRLSRFRDRGPSPDDERRRITPGRVLKWLALALAGQLLSLALFLVSAQLQDRVSDDAEKTLSSEGSLLIALMLVLAQTHAGRSIDESQSGPAPPTRSSSPHRIQQRPQLSIPRDSFAEIPGHGAQKINAAYALGGPALMIETVEGFMGNGVEIGHLIEVDFDDFPKLIDALGEIT